MAFFLLHIYSNVDGGILGTALDTASNLQVGDCTKLTKAEVAMQEKWHMLLRKYSEGEWAAVAPINPFFLFLFI